MQEPQHHASLKGQTRALEHRSKYLTKRCRTGRVNLLFPFNELLKII